MKPFYLLIIAVLTATLSSAQTPVLRGPAIYLNVFGSTYSGVSLNGDFRVFSTAKRTAFLMGGFSYHNFSKEHSYLNISAGVNLVRGRGNHHHEFGAAFNFTEGGETAGSTLASKSIYALVLTGYRYQRPTGGFFFRIYYCPMIKLKEYGNTYFFGGDMEFFPVYLGSGIGYSFGSK